MDVASGGKAASASYSITCTECGHEAPQNFKAPLCNRCGGLLTIEISLEGAGAKGWRTGQPGVWRYRPLLPVARETEPVSLGEGGTPLLKSQRLQEKFGIKNLYVKYEGTNPTGSFKDRGMTVGVTRALELKERVVACASTGNTSASLAAYAARAGLRAVVLIPSGGVGKGKLTQAAAAGAHIIEVEGAFDDAIKLLLDSAGGSGVYVLNSVNPFRIEGQKTVAFEVCEQLGRAPDNFVLPVGNAGNISAAWKGFSELEKLGVIDSAPRMIGVQASGASPIAEAVSKGSQSIGEVRNPQTVASAIRIGKPVSWKKALQAISESKGTAVAVEDEEIIRAQGLLSTLEGIFVEPASAAPVAALRRLLETKAIDRDELTVCVATGHGLKDPESPICEVRAKRMGADAASLKKALDEITSRPSGPSSN
ncbi:MAG: threonine synthase [Candidatus Brockarchaeota archaeon]|nr:threonine synthase [Candidatus Brockarchaeota archaeon]